MADPFAQDRAKIETRLEEICSTHLAALPGSLADAIRYGLLSPGKRIRPLLVLVAYRAGKGAADPSMLACAIEVIHAYSLIHDDLPCMDDDDMRRGRPTVHRLHGSRAAIVAGVAMIPVAAAVARRSARDLGLPPAIQREVVGTLLNAAGASGMIGGQLDDLTGEGVSLSLEAREAIHAAKTAALIVAAVRIGGLAAGVAPAQLSALATYGRSLGLAFQIMDDVLDVTSTTGVLGKTTGRDVALGKSTYPALLGVEGARARARELVEAGLASVREQGLLTRELTQVANFMVSRTS